MFVVTGIADIYILHMLTFPKNFFSASTEGLKSEAISTAR